MSRKKIFGALFVVAVLVLAVLSSIGNIHDNPELLQEISR